MFCSIAPPASLIDQLLQKIKIQSYYLFFISYVVYNECTKNKTRVENVRTFLGRAKLLMEFKKINL